jgi:hypothetical protein
MEPTFERWRVGTVTCSSLEFHSLLSEELVPDCLARKQRGMMLLRRPQMMKISSFGIMLKFNNWEVAGLGFQVFTKLCTFTVALRGIG